MNSYEYTLCKRFEKAIIDCLENFSGIVCKTDNCIIFDDGAAIQPLVAFEIKMTEEIFSKLRRDELIEIIGDADYNIIVLQQQLPYNGRYLPISCYVALYKKV